MNLDVFDNYCNIQDDLPIILEVNAVPNIGPHSLVARQLAAGRVKLKYGPFQYNDLCGWSPLM